MIFVFKFFDDIIFIRPSRAQDVDQPCKIHEQSMLKPKWGREGEMSDLQLDSKPMEKKKNKKKKTKEKQRKRKEKKKKERKNVGLGFKWGKMREWEVWMV